MAVVALCSTAECPLLNGIMLMSVARSMMMSARLPGMSEPVLSAMPMALAPLMVPISRHWVCVSRSLSTGVFGTGEAMWNASRI